MIVKQELNGIDIDDIGNLENLQMILFIREECGNLKVFVDDRELTRNIAKKKKQGLLQASRYPFCEKCYKREYFVNNKHVEYCQSVR